MLRSSHRECSIKKMNFVKFTGKHLCRVSLLRKMTLQHRCFYVNFARFFRISFFTEQLPATASASVEKKSVYFPNVNFPNLHIHYGIFGILDNIFGFSFHVDSIHEYWAMKSNLSSEKYT